MLTVPAQVSPSLLVLTVSVQGRLLGGTQMAPSLAPLQLLSVLCWLVVLL
jgi:hypothetical protein